MKVVVRFLPSFLNPSLMTFKPIDTPPALPLPQRSYYGPTKTPRTSTIRWGDDSSMAEGFSNAKRFNDGETATMRWVRQHLPPSQSNRDDNAEGRQFDDDDTGQWRYSSIAGIRVLRQQYRFDNGDIYSPIDETYGP